MFTRHLCSHCCCFGKKGRLPKEPGHHDAGTVKSPKGYQSHCSFTIQCFVASALLSWFLSWLQTRRAAFNVGISGFYPRTSETVFLNLGPGCSKSQAELLSFLPCNRQAERASFGFISFQLIALSPKFNKNLVFAHSLDVSFHCMRTRRSMHFI